MNKNIVYEHKINNQKGFEKRIKELENEVVVMKENVSDLYMKMRLNKVNEKGFSSVVFGELNKLETKANNVDSHMRWIVKQETLREQREIELREEKDRKIEKRDDVIAVIIAIIIIGLAMVGLGTLVSLIWR